MGKQSQKTCPKTSSLPREVDFLSPPVTHLQESVPSTGSCPHRLPGKDHVLLAQKLQLMAESWTGVVLQLVFDE